MAHELNNPLGGIKNAAYLLGMVLEQREPEVAEALEIVEREVATCARIVGSLLAFTRTSLPFRRQVDLNEVIREALARAAVPERIAVLCQLDGSLPPVPADRDQIGQAFDNVLCNAIQAMSPPYGVQEGGQLTVESRATDTGCVVVSIADTGVGIPEEDLERIFQPLYTTKAKGIGLGLALAKRLVEGHGGSIEVDSQEGVGSIFTVRLPIEQGLALRVTEEKDK
jgi:signal transduction histidine kinase